MSIRWKTEDGQIVEHPANVRDKFQVEELKTNLRVASPKFRRMIRR